MMLIGMIMPYAGPVNPGTAPKLEAAGWLPCDGSAVSRTVYKDLFESIGNSWGAGDNVSTFNLPDLRGYFMRGVDQGAGQDPDVGRRTPIRPGGNFGGAVGSFQKDEVGVHNHLHRGVTLDTNTWRDGGAATGGYVVYETPNHPTTFTDGESRPVNVYVEFLVCYKLRP